MRRRTDAARNGRNGKGQGDAAGSGSYMMPHLQISPKFRIVLQPSAISLAIVAYPYPPRR